ncbi:MAG: tRNA lysidine(34) synthetase TilS [Gammaproteobacteria bacterium]|nr:MAG: tRNA lysidine(34) synthetase TilS [Gammaproteobacteria bacterium]
MSSPKNNLQPGLILKQLPRAPHYHVAFSGGVDSHVLLHLLAAQRDILPGCLAAVHVNHHIQQHSGDWEVHCRSVCEELDVPCRFLHVDGKARRGESPEAAARTARYRALADWLPAGDVLLTAQHQDDQAETLLLQLLRGAGPRGLAAMPVEADLGNGRLVRPLLDFRRRDILDYAHQHRLRWVEDPSNTDTRYDRNLLRHQVMPELQQHWPGVSKVLARAARHQADQLELADVLAAQDCAACRCPDASLSLPELQVLSPARQRNLIRFQVAEQGLPLPSQAVLDRILEEVLASREDARPCVHWPGGEVRRFRDGLFIMPPLPVQNPTSCYAWSFSYPLVLEQAGGVLSAKPVIGKGVRIPANTGNVQVRFRRGGERLQPAGRGHRHTLKNLFQEWQVPNWERERVPLVYQGEQLVAVAGLCVCEGFQAGANEQGVGLHWSRMPES